MGFPRAVLWAVWMVALMVVTSAMMKVALLVVLMAAQTVGRWVDAMVAPTVGTKGSTKVVAMAAWTVDGTA